MRKRYGQGIRAAGRQNATAFGFSVMITATYGVVSNLEPESTHFWYALLFAAGGVTGFAVVMSAAARAFDRPEETEGFEGLTLVAVLNVVSVIGAVGVAAAVAAAGNGWWVWLTAPLAASSAYLPLNGLEHALAEHEEDKDDGAPSNVS